MTVISDYALSRTKYFLRERDLREIQPRFRLRNSRLVYPARSYAVCTFSPYTYLSSDTAQNLTVEHWHTWSLCMSAGNNWITIW